MHVFLRCRWWSNMTHLYILRKYIVPEHNMIIYYINWGYFSFIYKFRIYFHWVVEIKYLINCGSHEWNMMIFMPQNKNKSSIYSNNLNFLLIIYFFLFFTLLFESNKRRKDTFMPRQKPSTKSGKMSVNIINWLVLKSLIKSN
jgi:hypothetical protein